MDEADRAFAEATTNAGFAARAALPPGTHYVLITYSHDREGLCFTGSGDETVLDKLLEAAVAARASGDADEVVRGTIS